MRGNLVCPDTGGPVSFELGNDARSVTRDWKKSFEFKCPDCGDMHVIAFKEITIDGVLSGFRDDFDRLLLGSHGGR